MGLLSVDYENNGRFVSLENSEKRNTSSFDNSFDGDTVISVDGQQWETPFLAKEYQNKVALKWFKELSKGILKDFDFIRNAPFREEVVMGTDGFEDWDEARKHICFSLQIYEDWGVSSSNEVTVALQAGVGCEGAYIDMTSGAFCFKIPNDIFFGDKSGLIEYKEKILKEIQKSEYHSYTLNDESCQVEFANVVLKNFAPLQDLVSSVISEHQSAEFDMVSLYFTCGSPLDAGIRRVYKGLRTCKDISGKPREVIREVAFIMGD